MLLVRHPRLLGGWKVTIKRCARERIKVCTHTVALTPVVKVHILCVSSGSCSAHLSEFVLRESVWLRVIFFAHIRNFLL